MNTTTDYSGRTVDLEVFQTEAVPEAVLRLDLSATYGGKHRKVTGIQKLMQRYMILLLTAKGSIRYMPERGTQLMPAVLGGLLQSRSDIVQYFGFADGDAASQLKSQDLSEEGQLRPADEKYGKSWLTDYLIDVSSTTLYLKIKLQSQAGSAYTFVLPVT